MKYDLVLYISENRIWAREIKDGGEILEFGWDEGSIATVFKKISRKFKQKSLRVVLGNDISYSFVLRGREENLTRENVLSAAKLAAPKGLDDESFDWKTINSEVEGDLKLIQICGMRKRELQAISVAVNENKMKVEMMLPVGIFLARESRQLSRPSLTLWTGMENVGVIAKKGVAYHSRTLSELFDNDVEELVNFGTEKLDLELKDLVIDINNGKE